VIYPAFCKLQGDNAKIQSGFLKVVKYLSLFIFPILTGYLAISDVFIMTVFGAKWAECILPSQILVIAGMTKAVGAPIGSIFKSKGRPDISLKFNSASFILTVTLMLLFVGHGIAGIATAVLIASVISFVAAQYICNGMIGLKAAQYIRNLSLTLVSSVIMSAAVFGLKLALVSKQMLAGIPLLSILIAFGVVMYLFILYIIDRRIFTEVKEIVKEVRS